MEWAGQKLSFLQLVRKRPRQYVGPSHVEQRRGHRKLPFKKNKNATCVLNSTQYIKHTLNKPTVGRLLEVDIGVPEGPPCDHVPAYADGEDGPGRAEFLVQHGLRHVLVQIPDVQRGHGVTGSAGVHLGAGVVGKTSPENAETKPKGVEVGGGGEAPGILGNVNGTDRPGRLATVDLTTAAF